MLVKVPERAVLTASLMSGGIVGLLGVAVFGAVHAVLIVPIWARLPGGIPFGILGGVAMGWALHEVRAGGRWRASMPYGLAFGFLLWLTLAPATACGAILRLAGLHSPDDAWELALELLLAFSTGAAAGRLAGNRWRAALAVGAATIALLLVMGGPIPVTRSPRAAGLFAAFAGVYPLCGAALALLTPAVAGWLRASPAAGG